jgi:L-threonylcarbamoyladenylate synthase
MDDAESLNHPGRGGDCAGPRSSEVRVLTIDPLRPDADVIARAASCIAGGGVVIFPTETFYGLGGDPWQPTVVERVFDIKRRDMGKPLPLIAADDAAIRQVAANWPSEADLLARAFWPGPLTLVLAASTLLPPALHAHTGKIAVRVSSHAVAKGLASAVGGLLISTSANLSGQPPCRHPDELASELLSQVDRVLHAGPTLGGQPSTLVDVTVHPPQLVREGAIGWERIETVLSG